MKYNETFSVIPTICFWNAICATKSKLSVTIYQNVFHFSLAHSNFYLEVANISKKTLHFIIH